MGELRDLLAEDSILAALSPAELAILREAGSGRTLEQIAGVHGFGTLDGARRAVDGVRVKAQAAVRAAGGAPAGSSPPRAARRRSSDSRADLLALFEQKPEWTVREASYALEKSDERLRQMLAELADEGVLEWVMGTGEKGYGARLYRLASSGTVNAPPVTESPVEVAVLPGRGPVLQRDPSMGELRVRYCSILLDRLERVEELPSAAAGRLQARIDRLLGLATAEPPVSD